MLERKPKLVVAGGVVMDFMFAVPNWPQPGESVQGTFHPVPGGKGLNQATACARLGAETSIISARGDDGYGRWLSEILESEQVRSHIQVIGRVGNDSRIVTDVTAVVVADGRPGFIGCRRATSELTLAHVEAFAQAIRDSDAVLVTYDASENAISKVVEIARSERKHIIINAAPPAEIALHLIDGADYVVLNEWEAREWLRLSSRDFSEEELENMLDVRVGEYLLNHGAHTVIITTGAQGCIVMSKSSGDSADSVAVRHLRAFRVPLHDTAGASDAFCAGLAVALAERQPHQDRIRFASAAGALACMNAGAYPSMPTRETLQGFLSEHLDERLDYGN